MNQQTTYRYLATKNSGALGNIYLHILFGVSVTLVTKIEQPLNLCVYVNLNQALCEHVNEYMHECSCNVFVFMLKHTK